MLALAVIPNLFLVMAVAICVFVLWRHRHPRHELIFAALTLLENDTLQHRTARFATGIPNLRRAG